MRRRDDRRERGDTGQRLVSHAGFGAWGLFVWQRGLGLASQRAELSVVLVGPQSDVLILNPCIEPL